MNDQPNLRQFLDEVNAFAEDPSAAPAPAQSGTAAAPIGKVLETDANAYFRLPS